jgi:mRNA interferase MazF
VDLVADRFDVYLVALDPAVGAEMRKTRPCAIVSPESMHRRLHTFIIIPLTTGRTGWPTRVPCKFAGREGELALDQMRSVDKRRAVKRVGRLDAPTVDELLLALKEFFA